MKYLYEELNLSENFSVNDVDKAYRNIKCPTKRQIFAWKVLRDKYYCAIYKKYKNEDLIVRAGFTLDSFTLDEIDYYNLNLLTTPFNKLSENINDIKNPVVLLSTGGFYPIHDGHIKMMEEAKRVLIEDGYDIVGGYISLSHEEYIKGKPYYVLNQYDRINECMEYLKDSDWLMVDPWESIYVRDAINFTDVINRLELYLRKYVDKRIKVAYVFGADNVEFMYCFLKEGIAVCLNRNGYENIFEKTKEIKNDNMYFIEKDIKTSKLSSRNIRKDKVKTKKSYKDVGTYLIRNESLLPLESLLNKNNKEQLKLLQEEFLNEFILLLSDAFNNEIFIKVINMEYQLNKAYDILKGKNTINLDSYFKGTYNLEVSRLFDVSSYQNNYNYLIGRDNKSIDTQISKIKKGDYILVDDDSISGRTINSVKNLLPSNVKVNDVFLLASLINENVFDVVDLRDFVIGVKNSGLVVQLPNKDILRVPYVLPYVNLTTRASIPPSKVREFSISIWKMNKNFYEKFNKDFKLKNADKNFIKLMKYIGFNEEDKIIDICDFHIKKLSDERFKIIEYNDSIREDIISFLKSVAIDEFGFKEWEEYLENKNFEPYKLDTSKFLVVYDNKNNIIGTIGGLRVDNETIKINSFYIRSDYRFHKIGSKIYDEIIEFSKLNNYKYIILCTYDKYDIATKFYQNRDFKIYKTDGIERWYRKEL